MCGSLFYSIEVSNVSLLGDYLSFDGIDTITVNTDKASEVDLPITARIRNSYHQIDMVRPNQTVTTTFKWRGCADKTSDPGTFTGISTYPMFDYQTG